MESREELTSGSQAEVCCDVISSRNRTICKPQREVILRISDRGTPITVLIGRIQGPFQEGGRFMFEHHGRALLMPSKAKPGLAWRILRMTSLLEAVHRTVAQTPRFRRHSCMGLC